MGSEKSNWFLKLDKDVFKMINNSSSNITAAFSLYLLLLFMMNYKNRVLTSPKILLQQAGKEARQIDLLKVNINSLSVSGLIIKVIVNGKEITDQHFNKIKYNDTLEIFLSEPPAKNFITIRLVNEALYRLLPKRKLDNAIAVYCYIKLFEINNTPATISQEKIASALGIAENTVRAAIYELKPKGLLYTSGGNYNPLLNKKDCKKYKTFDADNLLDTKSLSTWKEKLKKKELDIREVQANPDTLSIIQDNEIRENIKRLFENPAYCPALLIGKYASTFMEMCYGKILEPGMMIPSSPIDNISHVRVFSNAKDYELLLYYFRITHSGSGYWFLFFLKTPNKKEQDIIQGVLDDHLKENIVILCSSYDTIAFPLVSRMVSVLKQPIKQITSIKSISLHDGYKYLAMYEKNNSAYKRGSEARKNYLKNKAPKAFMMENMSGAWDLRMQRTDTLLSKLTGGKTYLELL